LFFYQQGRLEANPTAALGNFAPGSLRLSEALPPYRLTPAEYLEKVPASQLFAAATFRGMNPNISHPYVQQWNFGIQRQIGAGSALEIRYVGNHGVRTWMARNINETNIFENGFLTEFQNAQRNLAINRASGRAASFANNGLPGQAPLPIFAAAFGTATGNYTSGTYITNLDTGAAGSLANALANNATFFCNLVGTAAFPACASRVGNVAGAGYPINFFNANPYATGRTVFWMDAAGQSNYNALQVEFRQRPTRGMQFNINYTWAHSLNIGSQNNIQAESNIFSTSRNFRLNYQPSSFDIRHVFRVHGTYDLPFGKGRLFVNHDGVLNKVLGGWTLGTIVTAQTGNPVSFGGGYGTFNQNADTGIALKGITTKGLQKAVKVQKTGNPWVLTIDPKYITTTGANAEYMAPNTT
ncbi:MAG: TonB-dependent receptor, partial [Gammaproteobacteria bacterium]